MSDARKRVGLWFSLCALGACSGAQVTGATGTDGGVGVRQKLPAGCEAMLAGCLAQQQICVEGPACAPCPAGQYAATEGVCSPLGTPLTHDFSLFTAKAGEEVAGLCQSWTIGNATELWVNAVELDQDEASHHSNWVFVPDDKFNGPDGVWRCSERNYDQLSGALAGGVLYAQSTQATHEVQRFPNSGAVRIPPYSRIISDVHILNATTRDVTGHARLSIYPIAAADVKVRLTPFHIAFNDLHIPPHARSQQRGDCSLDSSFESTLNQPLGIKIYYALQHFHVTGRRFFVKHLGGPRDGQTILDSDGLVGEPHGIGFDPPIDLGGDDGVSFGCEFQNDTDNVVRYGIGDQEMCEMLGFADSPLAFESTVRSVVADPAAPGPLPTFTGPCNTLAFKYDFTKAGGPPPGALPDGGM